MAPRQAGRGARWFARHTFGFWQALGLHVTANHFYEPVPDTRALRRTLWKPKTHLPGLDLNVEGQKKLATDLTRYTSEFDQLQKTDGYQMGNPSLTPGDAAIYYGLLRSTKPAKILEVGAGYSTLLALSALKRNAKEGKPGSLISVEPYPLPFVHRPEVRLLKQPVQETDLTEFTQLSRGDVLFIDSSHVVAVGSDVQREILEILPLLKPGVLVHFHDIFMPNEYPEEWIKNKKRFWTEQYLLQAFLSFNDVFKVRWAGNLMQHVAQDTLSKLTTQYDSRQHVLGSFWIERVA